MKYVVVVRSTNVRGWEGNDVSVYELEDGESVKDFVYQDIVDDWEDDLETIQEMWNSHTIDDSDGSIHFEGDEVCTTWYGIEKLEDLVK